MIIGVPKEIMHGERRVAATPETVAKFVKDGATVLVQIKKLILPSSNRLIIR